MEFELEIIKFIQSIRSEFLDQVMLLLTQIGDQFFFIGVALVLYWFVSKRAAFNLVNTFIFSAVTNEFLKGIVQRPRPYELDASLNVGDPTHGYSFPSGHSQNIAVISTQLYRDYGNQNKWLKWVLLSLMIIVPFTRVYLGQHYFTDVMAGLAVGVALTYVLSKVFVFPKGKEYKFGLLMIIPLTIVIVIVSIMDFQYDEIKNFYVAIGGYTGFMIGYAIDFLFIKYNEKAVKLSILWRALIGLAGILVLYIGLSAVFKAISPENVYLDFVRYGFIGLWGSAGSMYFFKLFKV